MISFHKQDTPILYLRPPVPAVMTPRKPDDQSAGEHSLRQPKMDNPARHIILVPRLTKTSIAVLREVGKLERGYYLDSRKWVVLEVLSRT